MPLGMQKEDEGLDFDIASGVVLHNKKNAPLFVTSNMWLENSIVGYKGKSLSCTHLRGKLMSSTMKRVSCFKITLFHASFFKNFIFQVKI